MNSRNCCTPWSREDRKEGSTALGLNEQEWLGVFPRHWLRKCQLCPPIFTSSTCNSCFSSHWDTDLDGSYSKEERFTLDHDQFVTGECPWDSSNVGGPETTAHPEVGLNFIPQVKLPSNHVSKLRTPFLLKCHNLLKTGSSAGSVPAQEPVEETSCSNCNTTWSSNS